MHRNSWAARDSDPQWYSEEVRGVAKDLQSIAQRCRALHSRKRERTWHP
nr:MAG TPA: hypothetical protein [Caudoviricetes sp.]